MKPLRQGSMAFQQAFPSIAQTEHALAIHFGWQRSAGCHRGAACRNGCEERQPVYHRICLRPTVYALSETDMLTLVYSLLLANGVSSWLFSVHKGNHRLGSIGTGLTQTEPLEQRYEFLQSLCAMVPSPTGYGVAADPACRVQARLRVRRFVRPQTSAAKPVGRDRDPVRAGLRWQIPGNTVRYEIITPSRAEITIAGKTHAVGPGTYIFYI